MAIVEVVKNLPNGGKVKKFVDEDYVPTQVVNEQEFLVTYFEALEEIKVSGDNRLKAIGNMFSYLINKYGKIELTDDVVKLMDELQASPKVPSFTKEKADKIKKVKE